MYRLLIFTFLIPVITMADFSISKSYPSVDNSQKYSFYENKEKTFIRYLESKKLIEKEVSTPLYHQLERSVRKIIKNVPDNDFSCSRKIKYEVSLDGKSYVFCNIPVANKETAILLNQIGQTF